MPTRVLITGDRHWDCPELARRVVGRLVARYGRDLVVVHGACRGVDQAFDSACLDARVSREPHPAMFKLDGPRAGPLRNDEMVRRGAAFCLAVHRDLASSKGTKDCVRRAWDAGIPVWVITDEDGEPVRLAERP